ESGSGRGSRGGSPRTHRRARSEGSGSRSETRAEAPGSEGGNSEGRNPARAEARGQDGPATGGGSRIRRSHPGGDRRAVRLISLSRDTGSRRLTVAAFLRMRNPQSRALRR